MTWLVSWHPQPDRRPVLLCLPPAGAGCSQFRLWQQTLGDGVAVLGVQLPGRENRWSDPPPASMAEVVRAVVAELDTLVAAGVRLTVFGHSFGGLLGYEVAAVLGRGTGRWPAEVVVAACRPPHMWVGAGLGLADDDAALARLLADRHLSEDELDEDSREVMIEVLRQDAQLSLTYRASARRPLDCPLTTWGGETDGTVSPGQLGGWAEYTTRRFERLLFPGGHYFHLESDGSVLKMLGELAVGAAP
jgi:surfactin synthase thioesterase subunit